MPTVWKEARGDGAHTAKTDGPAYEKATHSTSLLLSKLVWVPDHAIVGTLWHNLIPSKSAMTHLLEQQDFRLYAQNLGITLLYPAEDVNSLVPHIIAVELDGGKTLPAMSVHTH